MSGNLWKLFFFYWREHPNGYGDLYETGSANRISLTLDLQNFHQTVSEACRRT